MYNSYFNVCFICRILSVNTDEIRLLQSTGQYATEFLVIVTLQSFRSPQTGRCRTIAPSPVQMQCESFHTLFRIQNTIIPTGSSWTRQTILISTS